MSEGAISPGMFLIAAGLALPLLRADTRVVALLGAPVLALAYLWWLAPAGAEPFVTEAEYLGVALTPVRIDTLALLFGTVFCLAAGAAGLFALPSRNLTEQASALVYAGAGIGAVTAGDLLTLFVYWEVMAIASTLVVWAGGASARAAGLRYVVIHFLGGVLLMAGAAGHVAAAGDTSFVAMTADSPATWAILAAFLINAGAPPLWPWVADAYPRASWAGAVFLSAFTTKTSVYVLIRGFPGEEILIPIGIAMIVYGFVYAIREADLRRVLAYAIVNQVGIMVVAIGVGTTKALDGAAAQAFVHILYKALLFMCLGAILYRTGKTRAQDLGGLARAMPVTTVCCLIAAATALALPLTAGYASKALLSTGVGSSGEIWAWLAITAASAGVVFNAGIKVPWYALFRAPDRPWHELPKDPPAPMQAAMIGLAALCLILGPGYPLLYALTPEGGGYAPYKLATLSTQLQLVLAAGLGFFLLRRHIAPRDGRLLDFDWLWRDAGAAIALTARDKWLAGSTRAAERGLAALRRFLEGLYRMHGPESALARTRPSGYMALWMTMLLGVFMLFAFV